MNKVTYKAPVIDERLLYPEIVDWSFQEKMFKDHGKYCIRFRLIFEDGRTENRQVGGFRTKKEALEKKKEIMAKLYNREFAVYPNITVKEYYDYWLYYHVMKENESSYSVFMSYRNIINNYICPTIGNRKLNTVKRSDLVQALTAIPYKSVLKQAEHVLRVSFLFAKAKGFIERDLAAGAIKDNRQRLMMLEKEHADNTSAVNPTTENQRRTYNISEVCRLLVTCKLEKSIVYLPLLVTLTTGLRISELLALKFENIDTWDKMLYVETQIGRKLEFLEQSEDVLNKEVKTKTRNSIRKVSLPDCTLDELLLTFKQRKETGAAADAYIFCRSDGTALNRSYFMKEYKRMVEKAGIHQIRWHDLRHTYATLLYHNQINLKEISQALGHATEYFTKKVYIEDNTELETVTVLSALNPIIENAIIPKQEEVFDIRAALRYVF